MIMAIPAGEDGLLREKIFTRALADASGAPIKQEYVAFLKAAKVVSDTRLSPGETRMETFTFPSPARKPTRVDASFYYFHPATSDPTESKRIKFLSLTRELP